MPARKAKSPAALPKLNLMPPHIAAARRLTVAVIGTVVMVVLILAGMGVWWQSTAATAARLESELQQKTQEADQVRNLQNRAELIRSGVKALSDRLAILDDIRQSGPQVAQLLRQISSWIPDGVRLTALQFQGGPAPAGGMAAPAGMPGAPMIGPEAMGAPGMPGMMPASPSASGGTQISAVVLVGYTLSLHRLADFYSHLSQSDLFSSVQLDLFEWNGRPYQGGSLPPILPKKAGGQQGVPPQGQPQPTGQPQPGRPEALGPGGGAPSGAPGGEPGMGAHGSPAPMAAPGMGAHGSPSPMGAPSMGAHGGPPGTPPMMGMMPMGAPGMGMMAGSNIGAQVVRDPMAPRNAVYFVIRATLASPLRIAPKLYAAPQAAAPTGMPGAVPPGAMPPVAMPPGAPLGAMTPGAPPSPPATPGAAPTTPSPTPSQREEEGMRGGLGRRGMVGEE